MPPESHQLRGWKEIAAYLKASERSAKRWEGNRGLPIHRIPGTTRDVVFAHSEELDDWVRSAVAPMLAVSNPEDPQTQPGAPTVSGHGTEVPAGKWRGNGTRLLILVAVGLLLMAAYRILRIVNETVSPNPSRVAATTSAPQTGALAEPKASVTLRVSVSEPTRWSARVTVPDGDCTTLAVSGQSSIDVCPHRLGDGVLVDVISAGQGPARQVTTLRLEPNSEIRIVKPLTIDIEWLVPPNSKVNAR